MQGRELIFTEEDPMQNGVYFVIAIDEDINEQKAILEWFYGYWMDIGHYIAIKGHYKNNES